MDILIYCYAVGKTSFVLFFNKIQNTILYMYIKCDDVLAY